MMPRDNHDVGRETGLERKDPKTEHSRGGKRGETGGGQSAPLPRGWGSLTVLRGDGERKNTKTYKCAGKA